MAIVIPFRGILYNQEKVGDCKQVTAPPYDIISPEQQDRYYEKSEFNVIRLILAKQSPDDTQENNRYTRAAKSFNQWQADSILARDKEPALYFYHQEFSVPGGGREARDGFICLVRLEDKDKGVVIPHEKTLDKPKADRLQLMKSCSANFSQIFSLYSDPDNGVVQLLKNEIKEPPLIDVTDEDQTLHQLWRVSHSEVLKEVSKRLYEQSLFIADGHHRYETALNYRNYMAAEHSHKTGKEPFNYVMMYLTPMEGEGMLILPYHRVIHNIERFNFDSFEKKLDEYFEVTAFPFNGDTKPDVWKQFNDQLQERGKIRPAFGMYGAGQSSFHLLLLREHILDSFSDTDDSSAILKKLDVNVIESCIFKGVLGITSKDLQQQENISYVHDSDEGLELVEARGYQLAFFLNDTKSSEIRDVSERGETMPQKSTFFYPKLLSGLVINKIEPDESIEPSWV
jgi:uncharacterized protein (DUF1015 family)